MCSTRLVARCGQIAAIVIVVAQGAMAQQVTGVLGAPGATSTIDGKQLPAPDPKFGGVIKEGALQSKPWWATSHRATQGRAQRPAHHDR